MLNCQPGAFVAGDLVGKKWPSFAQIWSLLSTSKMIDSQLNYPVILRILGFFSSSFNRKIHHLKIFYCPFLGFVRFLPEATICQICRPEMHSYFLPKMEVNPIPAAKGQNKIQYHYHLLINKVDPYTSYKWPTINGFHQGYLHPYKWNYVTGKGAPP